MLNQEKRDRKKGGEYDYELFVYFINNDYVCNVNS